MRSRVELARFHSRKASPTFYFVVHKFFLSSELMWLVVHVSNRRVPTSATITAEPRQDFSRFLASHNIALFVELSRLVCLAVVTNRPRSRRLATQAIRQVVRAIAVKH